MFRPCTKYRSFVTPCVSTCFTNPQVAKGGRDDYVRLRVSESVDDRHGPDGLCIGNHHRTGRDCLFSQILAGNSITGWYGCLETLNCFIFRHLAKKFKLQLMYLTPNLAFFISFWHYDCYFLVAPCYFILFYFLLAFHLR